MKNEKPPQMICTMFSLGAGVLHCFVLCKLDVPCSSNWLLGEGPATLILRCLCLSRVTLSLARGPVSV